MDWPRFSLMWFLFSFKGRISRAKYWGYWLAYVGVSIVVSLIFGLIEGSTESGPAQPTMSGLAAAVVLIFMLVYVVGMAWSNLAVGVKRWHDRNKSGWWILISLVPLIGPIWTFVECGCLRGTDGDNRFGPDPLAPGLETVFE